MRLGARGFGNQLMTSFQSMAEVSVAERDHKLKASYVKGGTRAGVGRLTAGVQIIAPLHFWLTSVRQR